MIDDGIKGIEVPIRYIQSISQGCIRFDIGQPDFKVPGHIKAAAKDAIDNDILYYAPTRGLPELQKEIAKYESGKGMKFSEDNVIVTDGAMGALSIFFLSIKPKSEVIIFRPYFSPYTAMMAVSRCKPVICDLDDFDKKITSRTACIIVNSPRNPDGRVFNSEELKNIAEVAEKHNLAVVSDDVYDRIVFDVEAPSICKFYKNVFIVNSLSKTQAMTGFRIGWLAGPAEEISHIAKVNGTLNASINSVSQMAALAALRGPQGHVEKMRKEYMSRRNFIMERIDRIGWEYTRPGGAIYIFPNVRQDSWKLAIRLINEAKVSTVPGKAFGCDEYLRFCFGSVNKKEIGIAFDRIEKVLR